MDPFGTAEFTRDVLLLGTALVGGIVLPACRTRSEPTLREYLAERGDEVKPLGIERRAPGTGVLIYNNRLETPFKLVSCQPYSHQPWDIPAYRAEFQSEAGTEVRLLITLKQSDVSPGDPLVSGNYKVSVKLGDQTHRGVLALAANGTRGSVELPIGNFYFQCLTSDSPLESRRQPGMTTWFDDCYRASSTWEKWWCRLDPFP
jgi:hypothetical protein